MTEFQVNHNRSISILLSNAGSAGNSSGTGSKDAILQADFRILGYDVLPFTSNKQNAVIVGVANVLGNGVALSDIELSVLNTYDVSNDSSEKHLSTCMTIRWSSLGKGSKNHN